MPDGMAACGWCGGGLHLRDGNLPATCRFCGLNPRDGIRTPAATKARTTTRARGSVARARVTPLNPDPVGDPVLGIDPGSKYTGLVIRDGDAVVYAATLVCPADTSAVDWARIVLDEVKILLASRADLPVAIEGVSDPKGFFRGSKAPINPGHLMRAAIVLGSVVGHFDHAVIVPPGGNGSQPVDHYPACLVGRRPKDLPGNGHGAKTRNHEQSAYDVAGKGRAVLRTREQSPISLLAAFRSDTQASKSTPSTGFTKGATG